MKYFMFSYAVPSWPDPLHCILAYYNADCVVRVEFRLCLRRVELEGEIRLTVDELMREELKNLKMVMSQLCKKLFGDVQRWFEGYVVLQTPSPGTRFFFFFFDLAFLHAH